MNHKFQYFGKVENGSLKITNRKMFDRDIENVFNGKEISITIEKKRVKRSDPQNRYFHGIIIPIVQQGLLDAGYEEAKSREWVKDLIKMQCLVKETFSETTGECIKSLGKTSQLTKSEFCELVESVQRWSAQFLNVVIPNPGEQVDLFD